MPLETGTYLDDLVTTNPDGASDPKSAGDNHLRLIKTLLKNTFPGMAGRAFRVQSKSGNYTAVVNDNTSMLAFTAAATLTMTAAATLGNGHTNFVYAGGGDVVIDPNGSETINGSATLTVKSGNMAVVIGDATGFYALNVPTLAQIASTLTPPGIVHAYMGTVAPSGFVMCQGNTIGDSTSGADRANADTSDLFTLIWTAFSDTTAPIFTSSGTGSTRGGTAAADYAAHKRLTIPDIRGKAIFGKETVATLITAAISSIDGSVMGATGGSQSSQAHSHTGTTSSDGSHAHTYTSPNASGAGFFNLSAGPGPTGSTATGATTSSDGAHTHTMTTSTTGAGASQNMPPAIVMNFIVKL